MGKSNLRSCEFLKNLLEGVILGSISMKEASSHASKEGPRVLSRLSNEGFRFTNQLYEKLSMERGWEASIAAKQSNSEWKIGFVVQKKR